MVVDKDGSVLASPIAGQVGTHRSDPLLRQVARTGKPVAGAPDGENGHAYIEPLSLLGRDVVFAECRSSDALATGVAAFRRGLGLFVVLSLLIALPLFYVLGGRSVGALYRSALQRARRDGLTDLDNHRAFQDELARAVGQSRALRHDGHARAARHRRLQVRERPPRPPARRPPAVRARRAAARRPRRRPRLPPRR